MERQVRTLIDGPERSKVARERVLEIMIHTTDMKGDAWEWFVALLAAGTWA